MACSNGEGNGCAPRSRLRRDRAPARSPAGLARKTGKSVIASTVQTPHKNDMPSNSSKPVGPPQEQTKSPAGRRLIAAAVLIGLAIGGLALVDRFRERPMGLTPPHEPSQALITTP